MPEPVEVSLVGKVLAVRFDKEDMDIPLDLFNAEEEEALAAAFAPQGRGVKSTGTDRWIGRAYFALEQRRRDRRNELARLESLSEDQILEERKQRVRDWYGPKSSVALP